jgi:YNFM family putative membrane transporter
VAESSGPSPLGARAVALYLTGFAAFVGLYLPQPILPLLARDFSVDARVASLVISATILGIALASPVIGVLSDRYGRKRLMLAGALALASASLASAWAPTFELLIAVRFAQGLLLPTLFAVGVAYVADSLPTRTMRVVAGIYVAATVVGGMTGRVLAGATADLVGWRFGFGLSALLFLALIPLWARLPSANRPAGERTLGQAVRGTLGHLGNRTVLAGLLVGFFLFFAFQATFTYLPFHLERPPFSLSATLIGLTYLTYTAGVVSSGLAGWLRQRVGLRPALMTGFCLAAAGNALTLAAGLLTLLAGLVVLCLGNWLVHGLALGYVATAAPNDRAGANALYLLLYYLGGSMGAYLPGFLFPTLGYGGVVSASIVALGAGLLVAALMARPAPAPAAAG